MDPIDADRLVAELTDSLEKRDHVRTVALADQLLANFPDEPHFLWWRSIGLLAMGEPAAALEDATKAVTGNGEVYQYHLWVAYAAAGLGRKQQVREAFEKAVEVSVGAPEALAEYAVWMSSECGPKLAEDVARRAVAAGAEQPRSWAALGLSLWRQKRHTEAESCLKRALELDPECSFAQAVMADLLAGTGRRVEAAHLATLMDDGSANEFSEQIQQDAAEQQAWKRVLESDSYLAETRYQFNWKKEARRAVAWGVVIGLIVLSFVVLFSGYSIVAPVIVLPTIMGLRLLIRKP